MSSYDFFSSAQYRKGSLIQFPSSTSQTGYTEWVVLTKVSYLNRQRCEEEVSPARGTSNVVGTFRVHNTRHDIDAYMRVYLQVPIIGTELLPPSDRATQATQARFEEVTAVKIFHRHKSTVTPALFAISEDSQDDQGLVPGGFVTRFVFESVVGVRLAEDDLEPTLEEPHNFLKIFNREERDGIRRAFDIAYLQLREMGWEPGNPWATNLIWDADSSRIYFIDFRYPIDRKPQNDSGERTASNKSEAQYMNWYLYGLLIADSIRVDPTQYIL